MKRVRKIHEVELIASIGASVLIVTGIMAVKVDNTSQNVKHIGKKQSELEAEFQLQKDKIEEMEKLQQEIIKIYGQNIGAMEGLDKIKEDIIDLKTKHRETLTEIRAKTVAESKQKGKERKKWFNNIKSKASLF